MDIYNSCFITKTFHFYSIRIWDFMIFCPNFLFFLFLLYRLKISRERVRQLNTFPILRNFYVFIYLCVSVSMMRCFVSIVMKVHTAGGDLTDKVFIHLAYCMHFIFINLFCFCFLDILGPSTIFSSFHRNFRSCLWSFLWPSRCARLNSPNSLYHYYYLPSLLNLSRNI